MIDERESRTRLLGMAVVGLSGVLLASAALVLASPALMVGLIPGRLADPRFAHLTIRVVGAVVILLIVLCLVATVRWAGNRFSGLASALFDPRTLMKGLIGGFGVAVWLISFSIPTLASNAPGLLTDVVPSVFGDIDRIDTVLVVSGLVSLGLPLLAALAAVALYRARGAAAILAFVAVVLLIPVVTGVHEGANRLKEERRNNPTECVYFVGGYDCPGG